MSPKKGDLRGTTDGLTKIKGMRFFSPRNFVPEEPDKNITSTIKIKTYRDFSFLFKRKKGTNNAPQPTRD